MTLRYFIWTETFRVRQMEVDTDGHVFLSVLANYMQEAAGNHATRLGLSMQSLIDNNMVWILNRFTVRMYRYPVTGERIRIETWPSGADRLYAYRDFELFDESGEMILSARTAWLILDFVRRRPVMLSEEVKEIAAMNRRFASIDVPERPPRISGEVVRVTRFPVRLSDLDLNRHVNNVKYLEWVLETLTDQGTAVRPKSFDIQFKAESKYGDVVVAQKLFYPDNPGEDVTLHRILRETDNKELVVAQIMM